MEANEAAEIAAQSYWAAHPVVVPTLRHGACLETRPLGEGWPL
jgi:hypothetical protein